MARKQKPKAPRKLPKPKGLDEVQLNRLSIVLHGTRANVYSVALTMFRLKVTEEVFDQLEKIGLRKCVECNRWKNVGDFVQDDPVCNECLEPAEGVEEEE